MSNEIPLNSNESLVRFTSDYEYVLGATTGRSLEFAGMFRSANFLEDQVEQIRYDLEDTAKYFAEQQGLAPGATGWGFDGYGNFGVLLRENTGTLYNNIRAVRTGRTVHLKSEAKDKYGRYYGGHVEFGHGDVPPRPHLRPALQVVSESSRGKMRSALHNLLLGTFNGDMNLMFGTGKGLSSSYYRKGPGGITKFLGTGTRKQQMQYHFGSIRKDSGKNISRKMQGFRQTSSKTAKKSMGWKAQKSLNSTQRRAYRFGHTSKGRSMRSKAHTQAGKMRQMNPTQKRAYQFNKSQKGVNLRNQIRQSRNEKIARRNLLRNQLTNFYGTNNNYQYYTGIHSQGYTQAQNKGSSNYLKNYYSRK